MSTEIDRKINSRLRAFLLSHIEETKDNVRLAYVLGFRQKAGDTLNQQELEFLQEQEIEKRVLDKLEKIVDKVDHGAIKRRHGLLGEREAFAMIRFFYLVRIAQQGFLHLIANAYPTLESEAIIFLADKLVAGSMGGISTIHYEVAYNELIKNEAKNSARDIVFKLYNEVDEPVAEGFKTTYKEIMQIAHVIAGQGIYEHQKKEDGTYSTALFQPSIASVPAAYVVFPQLSMAASASASASADPKLNVPVAAAAAVENPTLPLPGFLLSSKTGPVTLPPPKDFKDDTANSAWTAPDAIVDEDHVDVESPVAAAAPPVSENVPDQTPIDKEEEDHHTDEHDADSAPETDQQQAATTTTTTRDTDRTATSRKKKSSKKKSSKSRRERLKRAESSRAAATAVAGQDATTHGEQFQDQEANDRANSIESNQKPSPQHEQEQEQEEDDDKDDEDDRFADADFSDDDQHEILQGDDDETKDTTHTIKVQQDNATPSTPTTTTTTTTATAAPPSPSQWQNFAAAFNNGADGSNTPLSHKSRSGSSSRMERR